MIKKSLLAIFFLFSQQLYSDAIRIMPLGDSITSDYAFSDDTNPRPYSIRHSYRNYLWYKLKNAGYSVDFVGSYKTGSAIKPYFDPDHQGYAGVSTVEVGGVLRRLLTANPPDVILLHLGTNDRAKVGFSGTNMSGMKKMFDEVARYERVHNHHIKIVLALIIGRGNNIFSGFTNTFNDNLYNLAVERISRGEDITIVDMQHDAGLNYSTDFRDNAHPNNAGYSKMANAWFKALSKILSKDDYAWLPAIYHISL